MGLFVIVCTMCLPLGAEADSLRIKQIITYRFVKLYFQIYIEIFINYRQIFISTGIYTLRYSSHFI